ncbi:MAG TPA: T9SS type A sorting domain-containing protein, partial [Bacteroidota bacterium]|nr:T9SS type A sorting domain-containing protein [Bacteroidota bacterium]
VPDSGDHWNFGANFPIHVIPDSITAVHEQEFPYGFVLYQNYPNPFNPTTIIGFRIAKMGLVVMKIFDIDGKEMATLISGTMLPGYHQVSWDATGFASGIFFCRLTAGGYQQTRKIIFVR